MITRTTQTGFLALTLALSAAVAQADPNADARKLIIAAYKASDAAAGRKDAKTLLSLMAPNYEMLNIQGKTLTRSGMNRSINAWFSRTKSLKIITSVTNISLKNDKIEVLGKELGKADTVDPRTQKQIIIISDSFFREVWSKRNGRWLKQNTKALRQRVTVNGKQQKL